MLRRFSALDLLAIVQEQIERNTGLRCFDHADNEQSPFYAVELVGIEPANTKTCYMDKMTVNVHCIASPSKRQTDALKLIQKLEEAMTEEVVLPDPYWLENQTEEGLQGAPKEDETGEMHAIVAFSFVIAYGFNCK